MLKSKSTAISVGYTDLSTRDLPRKADRRGGLSPNDASFNSIRLSLKSDRIGSERRVNVVSVEA